MEKWTGDNATLGEYLGDTFDLNRTISHTHTRKKRYFYLQDCEKQTYKQTK